MSKILRKLHFLTFGAGAGNPFAARRIADQAKRTELFASVSFVTGHTIFSEWPEFSAHRPFIEANPKGWGYFLWKAFLVDTWLKRIRPGEAVVYFDAGCEILPHNSHRLQAILAHLNAHDALLWTYAGYPEFNVAFWTKQNLLDKAVLEFKLKDVVKLPQLWASNVGLVRTTNNLSLTADWLRLSVADDYHLLDDTPSPILQKQLFIAHRWDQSILSLLVAGYGLDAYGSAPDYEYGAEHIDKWPILLEKPFLGSRNRTGVSQLEPLLRSWRLTAKRYLQKLAPPDLHGWSHDRINEIRSKWAEQLHAELDA